MSEIKKTILVADDDPSILDVLNIILDEIGGYNVSITTDGHSLLQMDDKHPDLILLDLWLSGINGKDICASLKADASTKEIPVIIFSANRDIKSIAESVGADDYLPKPFQMNELLDKVKRLLEVPV